MPDRITNGVFFTTPASLPKGRHTLSREQVTAAHRERMMIAATELMAGEGYRGVGVREICTRAGASRAAFYECFADKDACIYAAYDRFISVFTKRIAETEVLSDEWSDIVATVVRGYLGTLQQDLVSARAFLVEMDGLGHEARRRRRAALVGLASFMRERHREYLPTGGIDLPVSVYIGATYALRQIAADALDEQENPELLSIVPEVVEWLSRMLPGDTRS
jgi:AcrR family transcriptional regulator